MTIRAPLRLDEFVVESLNVRIRPEGPEGDADAEVPTPDVEVDILRAGDELQFMVPIEIRLNRHAAEFLRYGYGLDLRLLGFFSFEAELDAQQANRLITLNAPSILYGVARGIVAQVLALTSAGRVVLPSINFVQIMQDREKRLRRVSRRKKPGIEASRGAGPSATEGGASGLL